MGNSNEKTNRQNKNYLNSLVKQILETKSEKLKKAENIKKPRNRKPKRVKVNYIETCRNIAQEILKARLCQGSNNNASIYSSMLILSDLNQEELNNDIEDELSNSRQIDIISKLFFRQDDKFELVSNIIEDFALISSKEYQKEECVKKEMSPICKNVITLPNDKTFQELSLQEYLKKETERLNNDKEFLDYKSRQQDTIIKFDESSLFDSKIHQSLITHLNSTKKSDRKASIKTPNTNTNPKVFKMELKRSNTNSTRNNRARVGSSNNSTTSSTQINIRTNFKSPQVNSNQLRRKSEKTKSTENKQILTPSFKIDLRKRTESFSKGIKKEAQIKNATESPKKCIKIDIRELMSDERGIENYLDKFESTSRALTLPDINELIISKQSLNERGQIVIN
jgi:hypothetical protein